MARRPTSVDLEEVVAEALSAYRRSSGGAPGGGCDGSRQARLDRLAAPAPGEEVDDVDAMLEATSRLLSSYGLRRWTMEDVAERAGLGRATVYRRFESRERLVRATLVRDARRFFEAVATSVAAVTSFNDKVVEGFITGLDLLRLSPLPQLLRNEPASAVALLTSESTLRAGTRALLESYEDLVGSPIPPSEVMPAQAVAEALIRLGTSMLLTPGVLTGDGLPDRNAATAEAGRDSARRTLAQVIDPLVSAHTASGR